MNYRTRLEAKRDELCDKIIGQRNPEELSAHESNRIEGIYIGFNALMTQTIALAEALDKAIHLLPIAEHLQDEEWYRDEKIVQQALATFNQWLGEEK